ncbi:hypothetical protein LINGRAHAP2_LOCUS3926, partial [Linum grandiflorum]
MNSKEKAFVAACSDDDSNDSNKEHDGYMAIANEESDGTDVVE